ILQTALGQREAITIFGADYDTRDGTCLRDYVHVEDVIQAHILDLDYLQNGGKSDIFNLGSSQGVSVKEVLDTERAGTVEAVTAQIGPRRPGDPGVLIASSEKARRILGWEPQRTSVETIMRDAWNWHKTHPNGYAKE